MTINLDEIIARRRLPYVPGLTLATAKTLLDAGIKQAEQYRIPVAIAIVDTGGNLLAFNRMENAMLCTTQIAIDKAYTSVYGKCHSSTWGEMFAKAPAVSSHFHEHWMMLAAGLPLIKNEGIWGGVGVSGAVSEDLYIARAVLKAGGFSLDEVNSAIEKVESGKK